MGMDMYIFRAHSKKEIESENFWQYVNESENDEIPLGEVWYARKFWDLHNNMSFLRDYECGEFIELTKENLEEMIAFATHNTDYWDGFETVATLCKILYTFDEMNERGYHYYYEADW